MIELATGRDCSPYGFKESVRIFYVFLIPSKAKRQWYYNVVYI